MKAFVQAWPFRKDVSRGAASSVGREKIVFLVSHSSPGGVQEIWANLAESFYARGHSVELVALYPDRKPAREAPAGLPWRYILDERPRGPLMQVKLFVDLAAMLHSLKPSIVFSAMPAANILVAAAAMLVGSRTKVVISHHTPVETYNRVLNAIDGVICSNPCVSRVVSVSNVVASSLAAKPGRYLSKRRTIHNALPPRIEHRLAALREARRRRGANGAGRRIVATGRLARQKNYPVLLRAAALMPDVDIQIVGTGPDEADLKSLVASLGLGDRVSFLGQRSREETLEILAEGDVFVQPSLFEGHSLALLEAASLGLPLVVSDVPVQLEGITGADGRRCGVAVGIDDHSELARAILHILDDPAVRLEAGLRALHLSECNRHERMIEAYLEELPLEHAAMA